MRKILALPALLALLTLAPEAEAKPVAFCLTKTGKFVKGDTGSQPLRRCSKSQQKIVIRNTTTPKETPPVNNPPPPVIVPEPEADNPAIEAFHIDMTLGPESQRYLVAEAGDLAVSVSCWLYLNGSRVDWYVDGPDDMRPQLARPEFSQAWDGDTDFYVKFGPRAEFVSQDGAVIRIDATTVLGTKDADCAVTGTATIYEP